MTESDGIAELFEHTLQVGTGIVTEHARGMIDRRTAAARAQTSESTANAQRMHAKTAALDDRSSGTNPPQAMSEAEQQTADVAAVSNAHAVADVVKDGPRRAPTARRSRGGSDQGVERDRGR
jgi:hypothetical protein